MLDWADSRALVTTAAAPPVRVVGTGRVAEQARAAVAAWWAAAPAGADHPRDLVLATEAALDALVVAEPAPEAVWVLVGGEARAIAGVAGLIAGPVTPAVVGALAEGAVGRVIAEGTWAGAGPARRAGALLATSLLGDPSRFGDVVARVFGADACEVHVRAGADLHPVSGVGAAPGLAARIAADTGLPVIAADDGGGAVTWVATWCAPAITAEAVGLIALRFRGGVALDPTGLVELDLLAARVATELSWLRVHRQVVDDQARLRAAAMLDPLTGTWTRGALERLAGSAVAAARRRDEPLSVVVFDVDGLRRINDLHGHAVGDAALARVAAVIRAHVRLSDEVGRFGDDELAVLLVGASLDEAAGVADSLLRTIHAGGLVVGGERIPLSVRAGVTAVGPGEASSELLLRRAVHACAAAAPGAVAIARDSQPIEIARGLDADAQVAGPIGTTLGGCYRVIHEISRGASGVVYRGVDLGLNRPIAIKVLRHDLGRDRELVAKFRREASILASLRHPNLVEVHAFRSDDEVYFVMDLVEGPTVADVIDEALGRGERLDVDAVVAVIDEIADALTALHGAGIVHCDVKPENIVLDRRARRAVLIDVGECKRHDEVRRRVGTPGFAAPESIGDGEETAAIDVYALAATAYAMLTGRAPFGTGDPHTVFARQLAGPPPAASTARRGLPPTVDPVLQRGLAVDPAQRYGTPGAFAVALSRALRPTAVRAVVVPPVFAARSDRADAPASQADAVRGATFRVAAGVLAARVGEPWVRRIAELDRELGAAIAPTVPPLSWQPLDRLLELVAAATGGVDAGDALRAIGRGMVSVTFGHLYGADLTETSTHGLLRAVPALWSQYFSTGEASVLGAGDDRLVLRVTPGHAAPDLVAGHLERIAELTGAGGITVEWATDAVGLRFTVAWAQASA